MKNALIISMLLLPNSVYSQSVFFGPPTEYWSIPDDQHYNTYQEDEKHVCHKTSSGLVNKQECEMLPIEYIGEYVKRDCGYGGNCSDNIKYHAGIDYDYPNHQHDPADYTPDGERKYTDLIQGRLSTKYPCSDENAKYDSIVASGFGEVVYVNDTNIEIPHRTTDWGKIVRIRHFCDPRDPKSVKLCAKEGKDMVIYTQYAHLSKITVKQKDYVYKNQKIGIIGGSGNWIHHLHFEFKTKNDNGKGYIVVEGQKPPKGIILNTLNGKGYRNPFDFISPGGVRHLISSRLAPVGGGLQCVGPLCWTPTNVTCLNADSWYQFIDEEPVEKTVAICNDINKVSGGTSTPATDPPASGKRPDFITDKVTMGNQDGKREKYTWKINETAYVHDYIDNIGTADWWGSKDSIKVSFYLSKGSKEDSHSEWVRIGDRQNIKKENLKIKKDPKHEKIEFKLQNYADKGTVMPGRTYNFVVCADHPKDHDNNGGDVEEKHESNNCSTETVFYVDYGPPRNVDLIARNLALTGGRSQLQAGEKYGLQVEIANIGTQQPWNGFSSSYEIKGPGTGGVWQRIGEDTSRASSLYPNAIHFESMSSEQEVAAPMVGGDYVFRACADYTQAVPETDESNNCTAELPVYIAPPPMPDLITEGLQLTHGRTSLIAGELYGLTVAIRNIGDAAPSSNIRSSYQIKGPGTGGAWQFVADDGSDADQLYPGASQWEEITDEHGAHIPAVPGTYTARACADYQGNAAESDETNNCSEITFEVLPVPAGSPRIVITNPNSDDDWRSSETDHDFRWDYFDFPTPGHVRIEYSLDGGATWLLVDDETTNDGRKYWEDMCDYHTVDTHHAFVRITSVEYPYVYDISDEFSIDHAAECK